MGGRQGSIDEFSGAAVICLNKALFNTPKILACRPHLPAGSPAVSFPVVVTYLHTGSWEAGSSPTFGFSSLELICPQVNSNKGKIPLESFALEWGWEGEIALSILVSHLPVALWMVGRVGRDGVTHSYLGSGLNCLSLSLTQPPLSQLGSKYCHKTPKFPDLLLGEQLVRC